MSLATAPNSSRPTPRPGERVGILYGSYAGMEMTAAWSEGGKWCLAPDGDTEPIRWFSRDEIAPLGAFDDDAERLEPAAWRRVVELSDPSAELRLMRRTVKGSSSDWYAISGEQAAPTSMGWGADRLGALASLLESISQGG